MNPKQEKYINFVIEDILKYTEIDYDARTVQTPFPLILSSRKLTHPHFITLDFNIFPITDFYSIRSSFSQYIIGKYGVHDDELVRIWYEYRDRIKPLIQNINNG